MKHLIRSALLILFVSLFAGCEQLLPDAASCYDRTHSFYESNGSLLRDCVRECQSIYSKSPGCGYVVRKLDTGTLEVTQNYFDGASPKSNLTSENLSKVLDVSWISHITFDADCVAFQIDTLGSAERMLVYLPSDDPYAFYCKSDQWHPDDQWYPVVENGETIYKKRNDDNTVFFKQIGAHFYFVELHF